MYLVINDRNLISEQIKKKIYEVLEERMKVKMELYRQKNKNVKIIFENNIDIFGIYKIFIQKFLGKLWENPKIMFIILKNTEIKELKENLAPFIIDNFYNNYLSGNYMENNILYILALMIKDEIDKLTDIEQVATFLDNSRCGYLLEQLIKKIDIQIYFKKMIFGTIAKIENYSSRKINFNVNELDKKLSWLKSENYNQESNDILKSVKDSYKYTSNDSRRNPHQNGNNFSNNFLIDINSQYLEKMKSNDKKENNKDLNDYIEKFIEEINTNKSPDLFSNSCLIQHLLNSKMPTDILAIYTEQITEIISFINILINDLASNTFLIPYSIKCICKIIFSLIKNKFKNIRTVEINGFISKFFLGKLLIPIISNPTSNAYITDFVISENTLKNIKTTNLILIKLFSGCLFKNNNKEGNFTSFNKYFLEKMPEIFKFFEKVIDVKLPLFIEKLIQNNLEEDYEYNYFEENKGIIYTNISIVYKISNIENLIKGIYKSPELFESKEKNNTLEKFKLIFTKFENGEVFQNLRENEAKIINNYSSKILKELELGKKKEKQKKEKQSPNQIDEYECYFIHLEEIYEKNYKFLFQFQNKESDYYIELNSLKAKDLKSDEKIIINVKNYLCSTLGICRLLDISDFSQSQIKSSISILEEIKNYLSLPNFILNNNTIPCEWYINSLLESLPQLDKSYQENDFLKLYEELYNNLNEKIEQLSLNYLVVLKNRIKFMDKAKDYYNSLINAIKEITINEKIKYIAENIFFPVEVEFKYDDNDKTDVFKIKYSNIKEKNFEDKSILENNKTNTYIFKTIESFASNFPNLVEYQNFQDENPLQMMPKLKIPKALKFYFLLIREKIIKKQNIQDLDSSNIYGAKISDYFMNKIYDKIYPIEPDMQDSEIYRKSIMLSWIEPHMIINKDYIYETSLIDIIHQFQNVTSARTPQKKFGFIKKILELINNLIIFNEGDKKDISLDDITPVLFYIFIKAHPSKICSDLEFIKLFIDSEKGEYSFNIGQIESAINMLMNCDEKNFGLTKEEFSKRCKSVINIKKK